MYEIDGQPVNARSDWMHTPAPGRPQVRREERFPGIAQAVVIKGPLVAGELLVTGFLQGDGPTAQDAMASLTDAVHAAESLLESNVLHTVSIHGQDWQDMDLVSFGVVSGSFGNGRSIRAIVLPQGEGDGNGGRRVIARVQYRWRHMT